MPPRTGTPVKKQPITLAQLSSYDDILTDALVDRTYYWTAIPKNRPKYHASRGIREEEITNIIQTHLIVDPNVAIAEEKLLGVDGLKRFCNGLRTAKEKEDFKAHMRRYMSMYLPDCPWEVDSTNRYTIVTHEAKVTARRVIKRNETIKYLAGILVVVSPEEEKEMALRKKDFSLIWSSRSKSTSLFMGPARFANHDCNANARLVPKGQATIDIVACREIALGEEITVEYNDQYFGENNCECLCKSCEDNLVNGWASADGTSVKKSIEADSQGTEGYSFRRRRRESTADLSRTPSATPDVRPRILRTKKSQKSLAQDFSLAQASTAVQAMINTTNQKRKRYIRDDSLATPPVTPLTKKQKTTQYKLSPLQNAPADSPASSISRLEQRERSVASLSSAEGMLTDVTTPGTESPDPSILSPKLDMSLLKQEGDIDEVDVLRVPVAQTIGQDDGTTPSILPTIETVPESEKVSGNAPEHQIPSSSQAQAGEALQSGGVEEAPSHNNAESESTQETGHGPSRSLTSDIVQETPAQKQMGAEGLVTPRSDKSRVKAQTSVSHGRVPGDYTMTPLLLATADSAWIRCMNCNGAFVQPDAYYTRVNCPRCERHSKLYGYTWPKTERAGPKDKEERVLDHRTIHRFLDREDEARVRGRQFYPAKIETKKIVTKKVAKKAAPEPEAAYTLSKKFATKKPATKKSGKTAAPEQSEVAYTMGKVELSPPLPSMAVADTMTVESETSPNSGVRRSGRARRVSVRASSPSR